MSSKSLKSTLLRLVFVITVGMAGVWYGSLEDAPEAHVAATNAGR